MYTMYMYTAHIQVILAFTYIYIHIPKCQSQIIAQFTSTLTQTVTMDYFLLKWRKCTFSILMSAKVEVLL